MKTDLEGLFANMDIVEKVARLISEQDRIEADEAADFSDWHWEERADLARAIIKAVREAEPTT